MKKVNVLLFDDFTVLDAFGPVNVFNCLDKFYSVDFYSLHGGIIITHSLQIMSLPFEKIECFDIALIPGGFGTRQLVNDSGFISQLKTIAERSEKVLSVCTGSALLAKTGLLKGVRATSNKLSFDWVVTQGNDVQWIRKARWVVDGKYYSSSGVTAGIDMTLGFVKDTFSSEVAEKIAYSMEYIWNKNSDDDRFA